ncbi:Trihelix transcription factor GTL2 [Morus notabilis]|uniref:Trihelix transcription factor GTL2 n=1 Tax=Morus notabilis TaxID=981085 RepID=W9R6Q3_9ROSA|nr:trihelix transcription factor GTL2 isoform X2 [Morus notabilis]EXB39193.1 Trihelix transcription factor GTL2 [Morus notabilis]
MFDGVPPHDQLHQFIASSRAAAAASPLPLPLSSSPLHSQTAFSTNSFDVSAYNIIPHHHQLLLPHQQHQQPQFVHPILLHQSSNNNSHKSSINNEEKEASNLVEIERERSVPEPNNTIDDPAWSNDEVLALLRIRSTMENWFPDFTWEHVSRKLSEIGFKRSGEKCKEKFEEESRYFNNINNCTKSCRFLCTDHLEVEEEEEVEEGLNYHTQNPAHQTNIIGTQKRQIISVVLPENQDKVRGATGTGNGTAQISLEDQLGSPRNHDHDHHQTFNGSAKESDHDLENDHHDSSSTRSKSKKRKRQKIKFEMFKGFCEDIVSKMMSQQEEMHNKLVEDMVKRDKEKVEKEEAWKKQEMDRMNKELDIMAHEQAIAGDRQATIIDFLNKFISSSSSGTITTTTTTISSESDHHINHFSGPKKGKDSLDKAVLVKNTPKNHTDFSLTPLIQAAHGSLNDLEEQNNSNIVVEEQPSSSAMIVRPQNSSLSTQKNVISEQPQQNPTSSPTKNPSSTTSTQKVAINDIKDDVGKRWPRDEVLALINLRCSLYNSGDHIQEKEGSNSVVKAPLWERISQGMSELGYKRSAKRCKEKWENINKYFRKTKDVNKKRSVESRTCPYFHQLSTLYNKGTLVAPNSQGPDQEMNHHSSQLESLADHDHDDHDDDDHHHHSSDVHVAEGERSPHNHVVVVHHQEVVPAAFDFEF